jgi:hypothetical protein
VEQLRGVLSVVEASGADARCPAELVLGRGRLTHIDLHSHYLVTSAASGNLMSFPDMAVSSQMVTESTSWSTWKRFECPETGCSGDEGARRKVFERLEHALLPERPLR